MLKELLEQGFTIFLAADGRVQVGPKARLTDELRALIRDHRAALQVELVTTGRYVPGTLDRIYGLNVDDFGLTPPSPGLAGLRQRYFTWDLERRRHFNELAARFSCAQHLARQDAEQAAEAWLMEHETDEQDGPRIPAMKGVADDAA